jgi:hypothetical protein
LESASERRRKIMVPTKKPANNENPSKKPVNSKTPCEQIARGYFGLGDHERVVHVTSSEDFTLYIWARNVETSKGGVQIMTPPSQFRGNGSTGLQDGIVLDIPAQKGMNLGCVGANGGESLEITNASGARVTVFLTVITAYGASVSMTRE